MYYVKMAIFNLNILSFAFIKMSLIPIMLLMLYFSVNHNAYYNKK